MKKFIKTITVAALLTGLTACGSKEASSAGSIEDQFNGMALVEVDTDNATGLLKDVLDKGVLVVATSPDYPPAEFINDNGEISGSEMKLAQYIAASLGVKLQVEQMDFNAVLTAVDTGKADLGMSGFGYKKERAEQFEISHGYTGTDESSCHGLLIPADMVDEYKTLEDFSGKTIAAQASSLQEMYATDEIPNVVIEKVSTLDQAVLNIMAGKVDAVAMDCTTARNHAANSNGQLVKSDVEFDLTPYETYKGNVAVAKKGETDLIDAVNAIVDEVVASGIYETWYAEAKAEAGID